MCSEPCGELTEPENQDIHALWWKGNSNVCDFKGRNRSSFLTHQFVLEVSSIHLKNHNVVKNLLVTLAPVEVKLIEVVVGAVVGGCEGEVALVVADVQLGTMTVVRQVRGGWDAIAFPINDQSTFNSH